MRRPWKVVIGAVLSVAIAGGGVAIWQTNTTTNPSQPGESITANIFAVPATGTYSADGVSNCVRSATPKTYEQAKAASPRNICSYVFTGDPATSWDKACVAATAGDTIGVMPGTYRGVGGGSFLLGSDALNQDCSDGQGATYDPNAVEKGGSLASLTNWVTFKPGTNVNCTQTGSTTINMSKTAETGRMQFANGNWHAIIEGDCFNFDRTIHINDRGCPDTCGRPKNLIFRGNTKTRLMQWYGIEIIGATNMLFENIDYGPNVQCAANDELAFPVYFRCDPNGPYFEAWYATKGSNIAGCVPNNTDACAGFFAGGSPQGANEFVEPYIHGSGGYNYADLRFQNWHLHDGQAKGQGSGVHPGCFMFDGNQGIGNLPSHNMVFDNISCERQVIGIQHQDGGVTVQNSYFGCPVNDLTSGTGRWDECAAQAHVGISLRANDGNNNPRPVDQTVMHNILYRYNVFFDNPNFFNPTTINNAGIVIQQGGSFGSGFNNVRIIGNIFIGSDLIGCSFTGVTCADNAFLGASGVGTRPTTLTCDPFVDSQQATPDGLWRETTQLNPRLSGANCNVPLLNPSVLGADYQLGLDMDGNVRGATATYAGTDNS
jgi:hypothetical protein